MIYSTNKYAKKKGFGIRKGRTNFKIMFCIVRPLVIGAVLKKKKTECDWWSQEERDLTFDEWNSCKDVKEKLY